MKYVIKNCPAMDNDDITCQDCSCNECGMVACIERTDCLLKQIVEKCKAEWDLRPDMNIDDNFPKEILQLLEIEECENE